MVFRISNRATSLLDCFLRFIDHQPAQEHRERRRSTEATKLAWLRVEAPHAAQLDLGVNVSPRRHSNIRSIHQLVDRCLPLWLRVRRTLRVVLGRLISRALVYGRLITELWSRDTKA
jgi:hypothetical protein